MSIHHNFHVRSVTWFFSEDMSNERVLQWLSLTLPQLVERPSLGGGQEMRLELRGVDQYCIALEPHLLQQIKLRERGREGGREGEELLLRIQWNLR